MKNCDREQYIIDYLNGELSSSIQEQLEAHFDRCETCAALLADYRGLHQVLSQYRRPQPPHELFAGYQQELKTQFKTDTELAKFNNLLFNSWIAFFNTRSWSVRIVRAAVLVLMGVLVGRFVLSPDRGYKKPELPSSALVGQLAPLELNLMNSFFSESELFLLDLVNCNLDEETEASDFLISKEIAQKLLLRTFIIHDIAQQAQNEAILKFLTHLELLLYKIANLSDAEAIDVVNDLQNLIKTKRLLEETRRLRQSIEFSFSNKVQVIQDCEFNNLTINIL